MILNSHGGNDFKPLIRELGLKYADVFICFSNWFQALDKSKYFENPGDHADEMETSLMLYLRPDLVLPKEKWGAGIEKKSKIQGIKEGWAWAERKWPEISEDTGVGNPSLATKEKGEKYFGAITQRMGALIYDIAMADVDDLYE